MITIAGGYERASARNRPWWLGTARAIDSRHGYSVIKDVFTALPMNAVGIGFPIEHAYRETESGAAIAKWTTEVLAVGTRCGGE